MRKLVTVVVGLLVTSAWGGSVVYHNFDNPLGIYTHGSSLLYDDITPDRMDAEGAFLESLTLTVVNNDYLDLGGAYYPGATLFSCYVTVEFRSADPSTGLPDRLLGEHTQFLYFMDGIPSLGGSTTVTLDLSDLRLDSTGWEGLPDFFWLGVSWDGAYDLYEGDDAVGQVIYGYPSVGYSDDLMADHSSLFNFGGNPIANFGYELTMSTVKPGSDCADQNWDLDQDGDVDRDDLDGFSLCCNGPDMPRDTQCLLSFIDADCDNDGDVDMVDFQSMMLAVGTSG